MSKFVKNMKCNLMISSFLGIASATAMDSSSEERAKEYMRIAYRSANTLENYKERGGDYKNNKDWIEKSGDFYNQAVEALNLNHPYAASLLCRTLYDTPDTREQSIKYLEKSIAFKKAAGIRTGLSQDASLLMDAKNISTKTIEGIQRLEEIDINRAISCYEHLSCNLEEPQSDSAFEALMRLQEHPGSYFAIGQSYLKRGLPGEGLKWVEKYIGGLKKPYTAPLNHGESAILGYLESIVSKLNIDPALQLQAAYLTHQYVINVNMLPFEAFPTHLKYYNFLKQKKDQSQVQLQVARLVNKCVVDMGMPINEALPTCLLLKKTNDQFNQIATGIFPVSVILAKIAEDNAKKHPKLLFQFAQTQEAEAQESGDWNSVVDMYRRAADNGCPAGIERLVNSPDFYRIIEKTIGIQKATNLLVRHGQKQGLLNLYEQMKNPVFLVALSFMLEDKKAETTQNVSGLLAQYQDNYALAIDLNIHQLLNTKNLRKEDSYAMNSSIYIPQDGRKEWVISTDEYNTRGHFFGSKESALAFKKELVTLNTKLELEKQQKIQEISLQKMKIIDALSAKDQFDLAQEYNIVKEAIGTMLKYGDGNQSFQTGYILALEKSAEKGFLPAVEELQDLYSPQGTLPSSEKAAFYGQIKNILTDEDLGLLERVAKFQEAAKK